MKVDVSRMVIVEGYTFFGGYFATHFAKQSFRNKKLGRSNCLIPKYINQKLPGSENMFKMQFYNPHGLLNHVHVILPAISCRWLVACFFGKNSLMCWCFFPTLRMHLPMEAPDPRVMTLMKKASKQVGAT